MKDDEINKVLMDAWPRFASFHPNVRERKAFTIGHESRNGEVAKLQEAVGFLNSMVLAGEVHSDASEQIVREALK